MQLAILPLAITTMLGPQILAAIIFVTSKKSPVKVSLGYLAGILLAATGFIAAVYALARLLGLSPNASGQAPTWANTVESIIVGLLILAAVRTYLTRATAKPPRWLTGLQDATPKTAFKLALLLIFFMPTDIMVMVTVGLHLAAHGTGLVNFLSILPFLAVVLLIAGAPLLSYLLFHRRAVVLMPKIRDWMQDNSWLVNIIIYAFFLVLVLT